MSPTHPSMFEMSACANTRFQKADCVLVGGMPVNYNWLWTIWQPKFNHSTTMTRLSIVRPKQCIPIMCERTTGGAYWCNDSNSTKTALWRELAEFAGEVFTQCIIGIRSSGQTQFDEDSRVIVTDPLGQGCNMRYNDTLETRGPYKGVWPEDLEDPYRHAALVKHTRRQLVPALDPAPGTSGLMSSALTEVSQPSGIDCTSVIGRPTLFGDARRMFDDAMGEFIGGKKCTLGPKQCMSVGCKGDTAAFFWCNDSTETRTKPCYEPVEKGWLVILNCKGGGYGKWATTGGTFHDGDGRVFVVRPIDGRCELEYERTERKFVEVYGDE
ncbi:hypothetical protein QBC41DRAFT_347698 [Cercophora samala]|uniref:Uncharacterized protein n=1 Tax=Cercophora samala TaxID=330535 RepID=A0AA39ZBC5_9PEZI|nr:hypothetical protein QBC41DRAFT_347698 [Cercophora samala]